MSEAIKESTPTIRLIKTKCCTGCKKWLPLSLFYNIKSLKTGKSARCKVCTRGIIQAAKHRKIEAAQTDVKTKQLEYEKEASEEDVGSEEEASEEEENSIDIESDSKDSSDSQDGQ